MTSTLGQHAVTTAPGTSQAAPPRRRARKSGFQSPSINLFYVPALAILAVFSIYPVISGISLSVTNWDGYSPDRSFVGISNYLRLGTDPIFRMVFTNTLIYGIGSTIIQQVLGLGLALALNRRFRGRSVARAIIYLPVLVSPVIMGTMYYLLFQYNFGALNTVITGLGGEPVAWFANANYAVIIVVLVNSLQFVGISMIIYLAGLQTIPAELTEAAALDGAGSWRLFRHITLPLLQPAFATSVVLNLIGGLKLFDVIRVLTGGGPGYSTNSVSTYLSIVYFGEQNAGYASAMGVVLFLLIAVCTLGLNKLLDRGRVDL